MADFPEGSARGKRGHLANHELLTAAYDHESVARIYQERLQSVFSVLATLSRAIGMEARIDLRRSMQNGETSLGSDVAGPPIPAEIPGAVLAKVDAILAAACDSEGRGPARMFLLAQIDSESRRIGASAELRDLEGIRLLFAAQYPEYAIALTDERLHVALDVWVRRGGARKNKTIPAKWVALANLMNDIGLGPIKGSSLEQQWQTCDYKQALSREKNS